MVRLIRSAGAICGAALVVCAGAADASSRYTSRIVTRGNSDTIEVANTVAAMVLGQVMGEGSGKGGSKDGGAPDPTRAVPRGERLAARPAQQPFKPGAQPLAPQAGTLTLPALTPVTIEFLSPLSSNTSRPGELFSLRLAAPIEVDGQVLLPAGTLGVGEVIEAKKASGGGAPGVLILAARYLEFGGRQIRLRSLDATAVGQDKVSQLGRMGSRRVSVGGQVGSTLMNGAGISAAMPVVSVAGGAAAVVGGFVKGGDIAVGPGDRAPARTAQEERLAPAASPPPLPPSRPAPAEGDDSPAAITPPPGRGLVIFYRPATLSWSGFGCSVKENGRKISSLGSGRWFAMSAMPGRHIFRVTAETSDELRMEVEEGEVHYVACRMKMGPLVARPFIRPVNAEDLRGAGKLKPVDVADMGDEGPEGGAMKTLGRAKGEAMVPAGAQKAPTGTGRP